MVAVVPHLRLSWGGTLGVPPVEIWTNTLKWANDQSQAPDAGALESALLAIKAPLTTWFKSSAAQIGLNAALTWIKLNYIQANGLQRDVNTVQQDVTATVGATTFVNSPIWIQSYALTLRTGLKRGRGHAGRIFPPNCGSMASYQPGTGYLDPAAANAMALAFATCIRDVRNALNNSLFTLHPPLGQDGKAYDLVVISASRDGDARPPQSNEVVSVVCDRVPDIQHRRSNRLPRAEGNTVVIANIP